MRANTLITLGASVACAGLAIFLAKGWIDEAVREFTSNRTPAQAMAAPLPMAGVPVLVAESELRFGDELGRETLTVVDYPEGSVPSGALRSLEDLFTEPGARIVALTRINAGEPVLDYKVSLPGSRAVLSEVLTPGARAVTIRVSDDESVAGFVLPGDHVDVLFVRDEEGTTRYGQDMRADVLLQNVRVLGVDQNMDDQVEGSLLGSTVTLETSLQDSQKLALAREVGTLSLSLRAIGEQSLLAAPTLKREALLAKPIPKPRRPRSPKPKAGQDSAKITIIRGDATESVSVVKERDPVQATASLSGSTLAGGQP